MRRVLTVFALALLAVGALSGTATAKEGVAELSSTPAGTEAGDPWSPTVRLVGSPEALAQAKPAVVIKNVDSGERIRYEARPTNDPSAFTVEVVFPEAGWWTVAAFDGITGRAYPVGGQWLIQGPETAPPAVAPPAGSTSSFPIWPAVAGGTAFLLAAAGAALVFRRHRFGLSH
jgi:hypothetical protein